MSKLLQERNQSLSPINGLSEIDGRELFYKHCIPTGFPDRLLRGLILPWPRLASAEESVSEPRAVATGSSSFAELLDPIATAPGSDTSFDTLSEALGYFQTSALRTKTAAKLPPSPLQQLFQIPLPD